MSIPSDGWTPFTSAVQLEGSKPSLWFFMGVLVLAGIGIALQVNGVSEILVMFSTLVGAVILAVIQTKFSTRSNFPAVHDPKEVPRDKPIEDIERIKEIWRDTLKPDQPTWVLFSHGTCILVPIAEDAERIAIEILKQYGPLAVGTTLADFRVRKLSASSTYLVGYAHPSIFNIVHGQEAMFCEALEKHNIALIGNIGRSNRVFDAKVLKAVYVETNNNSN